MLDLCLLRFWSHFGIQNGVLVGGEMGKFSRVGVEEDLE